MNIMYVINDVWFTRVFDCLNEAREFVNTCNYPILYDVEEIFLN